MDAGRVVLLAALLLGPLAAELTAQGEPLEVGVRSTIPDVTYLWSNPENAARGEGGHSKLYGILAVRQIKAPDHLAKPVDEKFIASVLMNELEANGFKEFVPGQRPDILITASYGRGELANPYMNDTAEVGGVAGPVNQSRLLSTAQAATRGSMSMFPEAPGPNTWAAPITAEHAPPTQTITDWGQLMADKGVGHEGNLQKASYEKLFIRITAWDYPRSSAKKPVMLWKTIMAVDDPDHRDLNEVAPTMLHAGAPFFDKVPRQREVLVNTTLPEGRVRVGTPNVVEEKASK